tara:strand:+ start:655 stop:1623 length:969 start_codon:yes stop_codon:yes gene_type:complete
MKDIVSFKNTIEESLQRLDFPSFPKNLYEPIQYILSLDAKRIRSIALLISYKLFNENYSRAINAALAIEMFHNFTLIHDDIMDNASLRRNSKTVHEKWNNNIAILSGDALLVKSYMMLSNVDSKTRAQVIDKFSKAALIVCEGQQMDMDFETTNNVSIEDYLIMIEKKTSALFASSFEIGAIIGGANVIDQELIYNFGLNLGIAFQLQDDLLDVYGDTKKFGKKVGGDVIANKKTFLYLKSLELANSNQKEDLIKLYSQTDIDEKNKIEKVKNIFNQLDIINQIRKEIDKYHNHAITCLNKISSQKKDSLNYFIELLVKRDV